MQVYNQLGSESPDVEVAALKAMYQTTQQLIADGKISAGHDISDGGIAVALLEMAFAGNCRVDVSPNAIHEHVLPAAIDENVCVSNCCLLCKLSLAHLQHVCWLLLCA